MGLGDDRLLQFARAIPGGETMIAMTSATLVSPSSADALPPDGPVPSLAKQLIEHLRVAKKISSSISTAVTSSLPRVGLLGAHLGRPHGPDGHADLWTASDALRECSVPRRVLAIQGQSPPLDGCCVQPARSGGPLAHPCRQCAQLGRPAVCRRAAPLEAPAAFPEGIAELMREAGFSAQVEIGEFLRGGVRCVGRVSGLSRPRLLPRSGSGARSLRAPRPLRLRADALKFTSRFARDDTGSAQELTRTTSNPRIQALLFPDPGIPGGSHYGIECFVHQGVQPTCTKRSSESCLF